MNKRRIRPEREDAPFALRVVIFPDEDIPRLTLQGAADGVQRLKADGAGLACLQDGEIGHGDAHPLAQLGQGHLAPGKHHVKINADHIYHLEEKYSQPVRKFPAPSLQETAPAPAWLLPSSPESTDFPS